MTKKQRLAVVLLVLFFPAAVITGTRDPVFFPRVAFQPTKEVMNFTLLNQYMEKFSIDPNEQACFWVCEPHLYYFYGFDDKNLSGTSLYDKVFTSEHRSLYLVKRS